MIFDLMNKCIANTIKRIAAISLFAILLYLQPTTQVSAACFTLKTIPDVSPLPAKSTASVEIDTSGCNKPNTGFFSVKTECAPYWPDQLAGPYAVTSNKIIFPLSKCAVETNDRGGRHYVRLYYFDNQVTAIACHLTWSPICGQDLGTEFYYVYDPAPSQCSLIPEKSNWGTGEDPVRIKLQIKNVYSPDRLNLMWKPPGQPIGSLAIVKTYTSSDDGSTVYLPNRGIGTYNIWLEHQIFDPLKNILSYGKNLCSTSFTVVDKPKTDDGDDTTITHEVADVCNTVTDSNLNDKCVKCFISGGAWTAIGCIKTDPKIFIGQLLAFGIGIAGGIAFLMILYGGFQIITSSGDPEKLNAGKELIVAAVTGLLFIIFSLFILRLVGVNILGLPGFK